MNVAIVERVIGFVVGRDSACFSVSRQSEHGLKGVLNFVISEGGPDRVLPQQVAERIKDRHLILRITPAKIGIVSQCQPNVGAPCARESRVRIPNRFHRTARGARIANRPDARRLRSQWRRYKKVGTARSQICGGTADRVIVGRARKQVA